jgi:predicted phage baseplate assembly protein
MNGSSCGCITQSCGCCEGVEVLTPANVRNRPGLDALSYRVGTHARFLETMKARLSTMSVEGVGADGQTVETFRPLQGLTTRDSDDFSIALLDGWATVGDVLTFYQERIANEGYLRTATERRSVLELSRLVGYALRPGVAATAYLAYTLDDNQIAPVTIAAGARSQSIPGPDEMPQYFETSEDLIAQREWNNLQVRLKRPQDITLANALVIDTIQVAGVNTNLKAGDKLLLVFSDDGTAVAVRTVAAVETQFADQRTAIKLQPLAAKLLDCMQLVLTFMLAMRNLVPTDKTGEAKNALTAADVILQQVYLGTPVNPALWFKYIYGETAGNDNPTQPQVVSALDSLDAGIKHVLSTDDGTTPAITDPAQFVNPLLRDAVPQPRNSINLRRDLARAFLPPDSLLAGSGKSMAFATGTQGFARAYADTGTQLLVNFEPRLRDTYYSAWAGANLNPTRAPLKNLYALRSRASLFGASAAKLPTYYKKGDTDIGDIPPGTLRPQNLWIDWSYNTDENGILDEKGNNAFLDQGNDAIAVGSYVLAHTSSGSMVMRVADASTSPRTAYGLSSPSTQLVFDIPDDKPWRQVSTSKKISELRKVQMYAQSEALTVIDEPILDAVDTQEIQLDGLYRKLTSGRWVILSGERADIDQVKGVRVSELLMISGLSHGFDENLPGDTIHTKLVLSTQPAYKYKRDTLTIFGNVVKATHGATCNELLGSGDGAHSLQSFTLKQPPLTFVAAPTVAGAESTLHVFVNNVEWHETDSLVWLGAKDRGFATLTDDAGNTTLTFGNGMQGARLPTGVQNVDAIYRSGIGAAGNVKAQQISLLQTRPLGVKAVINPLRASGGADKESRDLARENAPLSVMPLDRLVSLQDYADFTRRFAGIAKALARRASDGQRELVYLTIAGAADAPIDPSSDLYMNLLAALVKFGDPDLPIRVDVRELKALLLSANVKLQADYRWDPVAMAIRTELLDRFGFDKRALGQPALRCEMISAIQNVPGVAYVDIDAFGAIPEKKTEIDINAIGPHRMTRRLLTQDEIAQQVAIITGNYANGQYGTNLEGALEPGKLHLLKLRRQLDGVDAFAGGNEGGLLRPADLVIFTPAVSDTLILNPIP